MATQATENKHAVTAVVFDGALGVVQREPPALRPGEALVGLRLAGVCSTDLEIVRGYMGFRGVLGHEFVGVVQACSAEEWIGQRVVGEINAACGHCQDCLAGRSRHCARRTVLGIQGRDGCLSERFSVPVANLHRVPDSVADEAAVFVEPLAAALEIAEQVHLVPGTHVLVLGDGKLGLLCVQVLMLQGCNVTLLGHHGSHLALARGWGARGSQDERDLSPHYDVVVEATGSPQGLRLALQRTRPRGTLVLKSTYAGGVEVNLAPLVVDELRLVGSRCGPFAPALALLEHGRVEVASLVSARFKLQEAVHAFARAREPGVLKVLLEP